MIPLKEIEKFFDDYEFDNKDIKIDICTTVTTSKRLVDSHIKILKANKGNKTFIPYYDRLKKLYLILKPKL